MFVVGAKHDFATFVYYEDSQEEQARETFEKWSKTNKNAFIAYVLSRAINGDTETFAMVFGEEVPEETSEQD